jgi:acetyl/propionyl-CoA carboxylase alpha subunit/acetyl-CoA carboxylase carboxyltransferase component
MNLKALLIANRGEIAVRIIRTASELGLRTVAIFSADDARSLHTRKADEAHPLQGKGVTAYLDIEQIIALAKQTGCDAIHPGYGFQAENAGFARRCSEEGIIFVGPRPEILDLFGDKARARVLAEHLGVPVLRGTSGPTTLSEAKKFINSLAKDSAMMIKAVAGGGGRGVRVVHTLEEVEEAYTRCRSEAQKAFGNSDLYVEEFMPKVRHIEVQIIGDNSGDVSHLWERDCSLQRRHQKLLEIAPSPGLSPKLRGRLTEAAVRLAEETHYNNLGTFEFLVESGTGEEEASWAFIEANPRLQVEHTVTEEVLGLDLVKIQLQLAVGQTLAELGLGQAEIPKPRGFALQVRVNMESMDADGHTKPSSGTLSAYELPSGPGVRVDSCGYAGYTPNLLFDSLLAKVIGYNPSEDFEAVVVRTYRALCEFKVEGLQTNIGFLQNILRHPKFLTNERYTRFVEDHLAELVVSETSAHRRLFFDQLIAPRLAGAKVDTIDPLAVLNHGKTDSDEGERTHTPVDVPELRTYDISGPAGTVAINAPMQGTIVSIAVREGDMVQQGGQLLVMEAMKMEHVIQAPISGMMRRLVVAVGDTVYEGYPLAFVEETDVEIIDAIESEAIDLDYVRPDLGEALERHAVGLDASRPEAVARRRKTGQRTARENIDDFCDPGTFVEYGPLIIAAQRNRRSLEDLIRNTPADGLIAGIGRVNGHLFEESRGQCIVLSYDYTVLAGTQGAWNHYKKDRMFELAEKWRLPVVFFTEGGGGRPGDTDKSHVAGLDCLAFNYFARLSGLVPMVGITSGRCFAGNAVLLGCCDVIIATAGSNIGVGGPAMIEGGGLGVFRPEEVGPMEVQVPNGVVDIPVADEAEAVRVAKKYLSYFQGPIGEWECADQRLLRGSIPENRLRYYDVRKVIDILADQGSVLEIRRNFGHGMVTAFIRIEGRPIGLVANNPVHLAGAIDSEGADKGARFIQLCDAFDIPLLFLCDTPGIMVGPESEKTALVRHAGRMFVNAANVTVPFFTIILRKAYGLGAQAMAGGSFKAPFFTVSWPTGEFGGMGLEGAVKLGFRKELADIKDPMERKDLFDEMVKRSYEKGKAVSTATYFEIDDVIDPAESRKWVITSLRSAPPPAPRSGKKRPNVDTW